MTVVEIGQSITHRRKELKLRQDDLAEMSGVTVRTIYNIEEGKGNPSLNTLSKLCDILGLEINVNVKKLAS